MEMDVDNEVIRRCYRLRQQIMGSLNVVYNASTSVIVLWNKYQIFIYEDLNFDNLPKSIVPEFIIHQLLLTNNYLLCLDDEGVLYTAPLKFKQSAPKRFKNSFVAREAGVLAIVKDDNETVFSLISESNKYSFGIHNVYSDFHLVFNMTISTESEVNMVQNNIIVCYQDINDELYVNMKRFFNIKDNNGAEIQNSFAAVTFDKRIVYGCLLNKNMADSNVSLLELYKCPSEISNMCIIENSQIHVLIGLAMGTVIKVSLSDKLKKPQVIHLNTSLYKLIAIKDTIIYTDCDTMWKCENTYCQSDIKFTQYFIKNVKDFVKFGDQLICSTYTNHIYLFPIDHKTCYLKPISEDYCSAENLFDKSEYFYKIMELVECNDELIKKINEERNYLVTLSISNRYDILDSLIQYNIFVYEDYQDIISENTNLIFTNDLRDYFDDEPFCFLIKIEASTLNNALNTVLSKVISDLTIHITLSTKQFILKTTTVKVVDQLKDMNVVIPLKKKTFNANTIHAHVMLVSSIPGAFEKRLNIWSIIHRKHIKLNCENFIKTKLDANKNVNLKELGDLSELINKIAFMNDKHLFKIIRLPQNNESMIWVFYVKLPNNFKEAFKSEIYLNKLFKTKRANAILQKINCEDFLRSNNILYFDIGHVKVSLEILNDPFSHPLLKVASLNCEVALAMRNFFSNLVYNAFEECEPEKEFVNLSVYTTVEMLQKELKQYCSHPAPNEFPILMDKFQKCIGDLPF